MLSKNKIVSGITITLALLILGACGTPNTVGNIDGNNNLTNNQTKKFDLNFSKVDDDRASQLNQILGRSGNENATADSGAPTAAPQASAGIIAESGNGASGKMAADAALSYLPYPGGYQQYVMIDFSEAKESGFTGTFLETLNNVAQPIALSLANDIRLVDSNGNTNNTGTNKNTSQSPEPRPEIDIYPAYNNYNWHFNYVSASKKETYNIYVSTKETLVIKQTWGLSNLDTTKVNIDSSQAIKLVSDAIKNRNFTSPDNVGVDYGRNAEVLYDIPEDTTWYFYLEQNKDGLVWSVNMNINVTYGDLSAPAIQESESFYSGGFAEGEEKPTLPPPQEPQYWYSGGYARVNAATGEILSLNRPVKYSNEKLPLPVDPVPMPLEAARDL